MPVHVVRSYIDVFYLRAHVALEQLVNRVAMVKPERARHVEEVILQAAQRGQLRGPADEDFVISILEQMEQPAQKTGKITVRLRFLSGPRVGGSPLISSSFLGLVPTQANGRRRLVKYTKVFFLYP